jgi:hypothetical protein
MSDTESGSAKRQHGVYESLTPGQRSLRARTAAHASWANTSNPAARTRPGAQAAFRRFEDQVDPDRTLPEDERYRRAKSAQRAHMSAIAQKSVKSRKAPGKSK